MNIGLILPQGFLDEETRSNYTVSHQMKKVWAIQLEMLTEIERVFSENHIQWWAFGGTLLGAIRHGGYIPWDDDIDIVVPRSDYNRLREIGASSFNPPFFYQDEFTEPGILYGHAKLRNIETTMITEKYLTDDNGCCSLCQGVFVDIFPLDRIPDSIEEQERWLKSIKSVAIPAWRLRKYSHRHIPKKDSVMDAQLALLNEIGRPNLLFELYERQLGNYSNENTSHVCIYGLWRKDSRWVFDSSCFANTIRVPFEFLTVPIPDGYDSILTQLYGDWRILRQERSMHSGINGSFYDTERSYLAYLNKNDGINQDLIKGLMSR